ncbi:DUF924 domain-containing protein [Candidatus Pelagibacter sp.]|nr:DUF924 domain-containing protein [Candidatus Pelagibacter sp.]MDA9956512.1 DUF924 domain-containing protein [Candidatus Pelagibacter sp.]
MHKRAQIILDFWFKETPPKKRFQKHKDFDQLIKDKFLQDYELASANEYDDWQDSALGCLALVILFDQFSRNMFREDKRAFIQDHKARLIVNDSVYAGFLDEMDQDQRLFMILPLIHSEEITDHDMAYYLLDKFLKDHPGLISIKKSWKDHTLVIKKFHRYPHRNLVLGRKFTPEELEFLNQPNSSW